MAENMSERRVREFFESQQFGVERIQTEQDEKRADYRVTYDNELYIVEVKGKEGDSQYIEDLAEKGEAVREDAVGRTNPTSKQIREAAKQLRATPAPEEAFRIIALVAEGNDPSIQLEQLVSTLYGSVELLLPKDSESLCSIPCFYFTFNECFELGDVDAFIVFAPSGSWVYINDFGMRTRTFRQSKLWRLHAAKGSVCDPEKLESQGEVFIADCDLDRHDEDKMKDYIRRKYGLGHLPPHLPIVAHPKKVTVGKVVNSR